MNLLILGGTVFLGRHLVAAALAAGHSVTTFNRGTHSLEEQDGVEKLIGDRAASLEVLKNRIWDAVIDTSGYDPAIVSKTVDVLKDSVANYVFISSISVYKGFPELGMDETATVKSVEAGDEVEYGSLKVACERAVEKVFVEQSTIIRPGLIVGPYDPSDRFTYWPMRIAKGGRIVAAGAPERNIQFIDCRDLADWMIRLVETKTSGLFNATGPEKPLTMRQFLDECNDVTGKNAQLVWLDDDTLSTASISPWMEMPLWIPESDTEHRGFLHMNCKRAHQAGLTYSKLTKTIQDTLTWGISRDTSHNWKAGLSEDRENELLAAKSNASI